MSNDTSLPSPDISAVMVRALVEVVQQRGIAAESLLGGSLDILRAEPPDKSVPLAQYQSLLARAVRLTGEPALGLQCALQASESSFGLMTPLLSHAPSLRHAIALATQFHALLFDAAQLRLDEHCGVARLSCDLAVGFGALDRSVVELVVAGLVRLLRAFGCTGSEIHAVCFEYGRPPHYHAYAATFAGAERFSQPFNGVEFSTRALDRLHLHRHAELHALMLTQAERRLDQCARPMSCADRVRTLARSRPPGSVPDMTEAARKLGLSVRSLRRRLQEEGTSYRELTQQMLRESACSMLRNPELSLQSIAHALGFAEATVFHRAFRRWTKRTPANYREMLAHSQPIAFRARAEPKLQHG